MTVLGLSLSGHLPTHHKHAHKHFHDRVPTKVTQLHVRAHTHTPYSPSEVEITNF